MQKIVIDTNVIVSSLTGVNNEGLKSTYQEADRHTWTKKELGEYEYVRMREMDELTREMFVEEKKAMEIAGNLMALGLDNDIIVKGTNLTNEQIEVLRNDRTA